MKLSKLLGLILLAGIVWMGGVEFEKWFSTSHEQKFVSTAEAIVGRPLTPGERCRGGAAHGATAVVRRSVRRFDPLLGIFSSGNGG